MIEASYASNFAKNPNYLNLNTSYDIKSIMHYQSNSFAKSGEYTLLSKSEPKVIPRNFLITNTDAKKIQRLYSCGIKEFDFMYDENLSNSTKPSIKLQISILIFINIFITI